MAGAMVGGAFLGAFFNVVLDRIDSPPVLNFIRGKKLLVQLLEKLKITLTVGKKLLNDAEKKQISDPHVKDWLDELKHVVYMADDLLDDVATKAALAAAATQKEVTTSNLITGFFNSQDRKMATRLKEIVDKLEHILKLKEGLDLKEIPMENSSSRVHSTSVPDRNIYGRNEDKKAIIKLLLDNNNNNEGEEVSVIPIVGIGGVGKTTLAQMVYSDDDVKKNFNSDSRAWVSVFEEFDIMRVTKALSEALIPEEASKLTTLNSLQEKLVEKLKGKKFLIVLDDVWIKDYHNWSLLKKPLQYGMRGSKILVTTRTEKVASLVQTVRPYCLSQLSYEDSWLVFANHACLSPGSCDNMTSLEKIGMEIVKKCGGLSLAAQSLGGSLRTTRDIRNWNNVLNSDIWTLSEGKSQIIPSLRVSYDYLHPDLKRCFLYCSLYPKDFEIEKNDMILLWMAEDLLPLQKNGKALEEVGDEYFDDLLLSSFLQRSSIPEKKDYYFGMHDLMHDLATFLGGEFYFRSNDIGQETTIGSKARHLSFTDFSSPDSTKSGVLGSSKFLRTVLRATDNKYAFQYDESPYIELSNLECLRVLSIYGFGRLITLPDSIGGLIHLRYLNLSWAGIKSLPESLCSLYNLQTLKLDFCENLTMLPSHTEYLENLHHLGIDETSIEEMPKRMGKLKQLCHLPYFVVGKSEHIKIKELGELSNLQGSFSIYDLENVENGSEALEARMMDKKHIQHLVLVWSSDEGCMDSQTEMDILCKLEPHQDLQSLKILGYRGTRYPDWVGKSCFLKMTSILLYGCNNCFTLPSLGKLPSLKDLAIFDMKTLEIIDGSFFNNNNNNNNDCGSLLTVPFPSLEFLGFSNMPSWEMWSCSEQPRAFPKLKRLAIEECPKLRGDLPSDLPALEELVIEDCEELTCSLQRAPALRKIRIVKASKVAESVFGAIIHKQPPCLQSVHFEILPNLKQVFISDCENLESLLVSQSWDFALQNLTHLEINECPNLVSLASEGLAAPSLTCSVVFDCDKLESLPPRMNTLLPKLEIFRMFNCPRIESFPEQGLPPSLTNIWIMNCEKVLSGLAWPSMDMLTVLCIFGPCDGIKSFPKEGLLPPSLKSLSLEDLSSLETLDCKGLLHLTHLQELRISFCPNLENMAGERLPASLTRLEIYGCPLLEEQCRMKHPHIWPKISHTHTIKVDRSVISRRRP